MLSLVTKSVQSTQHFPLYDCYVSSLFQANLISLPFSIHPRSTFLYNHKPEMLSVSLGSGWFGVSSRVMWCWPVCYTQLCFHRGIQRFNHTNTERKNARDMPNIWVLVDPFYFQEGRQKLEKRSRLRTVGHRRWSKNLRWSTQPLLWVVMQTL